MLHVVAENCCAACGCRGGLLRCMHSIPMWLAAARLEEQCGNLAKGRALLEQVGVFILIYRGQLSAQWCAAGLVLKQA